MWIMEALMLSRAWIMRALIPSVEHRFTAALPSGDPAPWLGAYITGLPSALGQPLIVQALCIVIRQHHTLTAGPGIWCTNSSGVAQGWGKPRRSRGRSWGRCLKYANILFAFDFPQFSSLMGFLVLETENTKGNGLKSLSLIPKLNEIIRFTWLLCSLVVSYIQSHKSFVTLAGYVCDKWSHILLCPTQITMAIA